MTQLNIYRDGHRYIIGRPEWQVSMSTTRGIAEAYSKAEALQIVKENESKSAEELDAMMDYYDTWDRFEDGCDAGYFGPAW